MPQWVNEKNLNGMSRHIMMLNWAYDVTWSPAICPVTTHHIILKLRCLNPWQWGQYYFMWFVKSEWLLKYSTERHQQWTPKFLASRQIKGAWHSQASRRISSKSAVAEDDNHFHDCQSDWMLSMYDFLLSQSLKKYLTKLLLSSRSPPFRPALHIPSVMAGHQV